MKEGCQTTLFVGCKIFISKLRHGAQKEKGEEEYIGDRSILGGNFISF